MLVLSRHTNESVIIGDGVVEITVVEIRGDKVRLGFSAPADVAINRAELFEVLQRDGVRYVDSQQARIAAAESGGSV